MKNFAVKFCVMWIVLAISLIDIGVSSVSAQQELPNLAAEEWIYNQVLLGIPADLAARFPNPKDRIIRGSFLLRLLKDKSSQNIARFGIDVSNAHVIDNVDLRYIEVHHQVVLKSMTFDGMVSFCRAHIYKDFWLSESTFNAGVDFCEAQADQNLMLNQNTFHAAVKLSAAKVMGSLALNGSAFLGESDLIDLSGAVVAKTLFLQEAKFNGPVDFRSMQIGQYILADKVEFLNPTVTINFEYVNVKASAFFPEAIFMGGASFGNVNIDGFFLLNKAKFNNADKEIIFEALTIRQHLQISEAVFEGPARFVYTKVGQLLNATSSHFNNSTAAINFGDIQVGEHALFQDAKFAGPMILRYSRIEKNLTLSRTIFDKAATFSNLSIGESIQIDNASFSSGADFSSTNAKNFSAIEARFTSPSEAANFNSMRIDGFVTFDRSIFAGPVIFAKTTVGHDFSAIGSQFNSPNNAVSFGEMEIGDSIFLDQSTFNGPVDFAFTKVDCVFSLNNTTFTNNIHAVSFSNVKVGENIYIDHPSFAGPVRMDFISVDEGLYLSNATLTNNFSFLDANARFVRFANVTWPVESGKVDLRGMKYKELEAHNDNTNGEMKYIGLLDRSAYSPEIYTQLQNYYQELGYRDNADYVFLAYKARERNTQLSWDKNYLHWWWSWFLEIFALFGRSPFRPLLWFLLFISIGDLIFRKQEKMMSLVEDPRPYHSFVYSLDLFLPFSRLGMAHDWAPLSNRRFANIYAFILNLLGWILIPIAILAIARVLD